MYAYRVPLADRKARQLAIFHSFTNQLVDGRLIAQKHTSVIQALR